MNQYRLQLDLPLDARAPAALIEELRDGPSLPVAQGHAAQCSLTQTGGSWRLLLACTVFCEMADIAAMLGRLGNWCAANDNNVVGQVENLDDGRELIEDIVFSQQQLMLVAARPGAEELYNYYR